MNGRAMSIEEHQDLLALLKAQSYLGEQNPDRLRDMREKCTKLRTCSRVLSMMMRLLLEAVNEDSPADDDVLGSLFGQVLTNLGSEFRQYRMISDRSYRLYHLDVMSDLLGYPVACRESWSGLTYMELNERLTKYEKAALGVNNLIAGFTEHYDKLVRGGLLGIVQKYIAIGDTLRDAAEVKRFIALVDNIYKRKRFNEEDPNDEYVANFLLHEADDRGLFECARERPPPYIFICSSSGNGKTQMVFNLAKDQPLLYILAKHNKEPARIVGTTQDAYAPFHKMSALFHKLVCEDMKNMGKAKQYVTLYHLIKLPSATFSLKSLSFLATLLEKTVDRYIELAALEGSNPDMGDELRTDCNVSWMQAEFDVIGSDFGEVPALTINEALKKCKDSLAKCSITRPIIFLDECNNHTKVHIFKRNIVRFVGIVPVIMGTHSKHYNMVVATHYSRQQMRPWCFVYSDLPSFSQTLIDDWSTDVRSLLSAIQPRPSDYDLRVKFIDLIAEISKLDRPWFVDVALRSLKETIPNSSIDIMEALQSALDDISSAFVKKKKSCDNPYFFQGQLSYAQNRGVEINMDDESEIGQAAIHCYLGHLCYFLNGQNKRRGTVTLTMGDDGEISCLYPGLHTARQCSYFSAAYFKSFAAQPLSSLAFCSTRLVNGRSIFPSKRPIYVAKGMSTAEASSKVAKMPSNAARVETRRSGDRFEALTNMAVIISLSRSEFKGMSASDWLPWFFGECSKKVPTLYVPVVFESEEVKNIFESIQLPFVGPCGEEWNVPLLQFLQSNMNANIGKMKSSRMATAVDATVSTLADEPLLYFQVKNYADDYTGSSILPVIAAMLNKGARLNILVVKEYGNMMNIKNYLENTPFIKKPGTTISSHFNQCLATVAEITSKLEDVHIKAGKRKAEDETRVNKIQPVSLPQMDVVVYYLKRVEDGSGPCILLKRLFGEVSAAQIVILFDEKTLDFGQQLL